MSIMIGLPCSGGIVSEKTTLGLFNLGKLLVRNDVDHGLHKQDLRLLIFSLTIRNTSICSFWIVILDLIQKMC